MLLILTSHQTFNLRLLLLLQALADKKKGITDEDLLALVGDEVHQAAVVWELVDLQVRRQCVYQIKDKIQFNGVQLSQLLLGAAARLLSCSSQCH